MFVFGRRSSEGAIVQCLPFAGLICYLEARLRQQSSYPQRGVYTCVHELTVSGSHSDPQGAH